MDELVRGDRIYLTDENGAEGLYVIVSVVGVPGGSAGDPTYALMPLDGGRIGSVG